MRTPGSFTERKTPQYKVADAKLPPLLFGIVVGQSFPGKRRVSFETYPSSLQESRVVPSQLVIEYLIEVLPAPNL